MSCSQRITLPFLLFGFSLIRGLSGMEESPSGPALPGTEEELPEPELYKRLYDFGLGKRAYSYVSEYKRLPVYNFGLGKRSKMYNFGLGKRNDGSEPTEIDLEYDYNENDNEDGTLPEEELYHDDDLQSIDKRYKTYSFGLGKRKSRYDFGLGKRLPKYDFGLGKRESKFSFGLGKRERLYNFGLGKRADRLYSFGLGKRPESDRVHSRFNFGLGKRSVEDKRAAPERFNFGIGKREVDPKEAENLENTSAEVDSVASISPDYENMNHTVELESHELMAHSDRRHIHKRSIPQYSFGLGKRELDYDNSEYVRLFRNPYNFGLGKRIPKYDFGLGKRSN